MAVKQFGNTWWGKAWLEALEERALVDPNRLPRGRTYARQERVIDLELSPGLLRAIVRGSRPAPYVSSLSLRVLTDEQWESVLDTVTEKASNAAALLAGEVPPDIGRFVLPDRGDLGPECSCPDWAEPCKHVAALCYVAADLFDADPFALLMLRGRGREDVLGAVRARRSERLGTDVAPPSFMPHGADPGTAAAAAYKREPKPLDRSPRLPRRPGTLVQLAVDPPADAGIAVDELAELVADAARRAWALLAGDGDSALHLGVGADVVRRAVTGDIERIAAATDLDETELRAAVAAWRIGGAAGLAINSRRIEVPTDAMTPGAAALGTNAKVRGNAVSVPGTQLRLDEDGHWWHFIADDELGWLLTAGPATDPTELL